MGRAHGGCGHAGTRHRRNHTLAFGSSATERRRNDPRRLVAPIRQDDACDTGAPVADAPRPAGAEWVRAWSLVAGAFLVHGGFRRDLLFAEVIAGTFGASPMSVSLIYGLSGCSCFFVSAVSGPLAYARTLLVSLAAALPHATLVATAQALGRRLGLLYTSRGVSLLAGPPALVVGIANFAGHAPPLVVFALLGLSGVALLAAIRPMTNSESKL